MPAQKSVKHKLTRRKSASRRRNPGYFVRWILLLGISVLLLWGSWRLFNSFRNRVWKEGTRITFAVAARDPVLYSYSPQSRELLVFRIPGSTQMEVAGGYGTFPAGNLLELGRGKGKEGDLLRLSIQRSLGIPVDAWLGEGGEKFFSPRPLSKIAAFKEVLSGSLLPTNLTFFDKAALILNVSGVGTADRRSLDLEVTKVLKREKFSDGVEGFVVVPEQGKLLFEALRDELIVREGKTLVVVNTTTERGLASRVANIGGVLGMRVVGIQTEGEEGDAPCIVKGKREHLRSVSAHRLSQIFQCKTEEGDTRAATSLEIILGRDFVNTF